MRPMNTHSKQRTAAFRMDSFLTSIIADLAPYLDEALVGRLFTSVGNPDLMRHLVSSELSDADCMESIPRYAALRQLEACFSKLPAYGARSASERKRLALDKFARSELLCRITNKRLRYYRSHLRRLSPHLRKVILMAQDEIHSLLGPLDSCYDDIMGQCGFGPGLTFGLHHDRRHIFYKIAGDQDVTPRCRQLALEVLKEYYPNWASKLSLHGYSLTTVLGNRVTTVPKTSGIDRTIGIEPSLNVFLQKGVDSYLASRLKAFGLHLDNQDYSIDVIRRRGTRVSTIDLSSASDSISRALVEMLLPADWYELLDTLRSHYYTLDGGRSWTLYEKFSSMGNATTFPLESMIFMAITRACCRVCGFSTEAIRDLVRVYGDDIIVPWECAGLLIEALRFLGFRTNTDKTFVFGPFRETCGVDLLDGVNVRPVYLRTIPSKPWQIASLFNRLLVNHYGFPLKRTCSYLYSLVEHPLTGPAYLGASALDPTSDAYSWYAGKCSEGDAYFFAPYSFHTPVVGFINGNPYQFWCAAKWGMLRRKKLPDVAEWTQYLAFLLGIERGEPLGQPIFGVLREEVRHEPFPPLDWWPECYAAQRAPSERIIRSIERAVIGEILRK